MRFLSNLAASALGSLIALVLLVIFGLAFLFALAASADQAPQVRRGSILLADLSGDWPETVSDDPLARAFGGEAALDLHDVTRALRRAGADPRIEGVWIRLGSVTASWASLQDVRRHIEAVRATGKPVYATSRSHYMREPEFFLASAADSVFLDMESLFEFNGFHVALTFFSDLLERAGVDPQAVRAGQFKGAVEPFTRRNMSDENRLQYQEIVDDIADVFATTVAEARSLDRETVETLLDDGGVGSAREALEAGLVDGLLYADEVGDLFREHLGLDPDEPVPAIEIRNYARVSDASAGIRTGNAGEIAVVHAEGAMMSGESGGPAIPGVADRALGSETFATAMREARRNERVRAVVVRVNSPGGSAPAADAMRREIELTAQKKPVLLSMGDAAASGGYWITTAADTIVAESLTLTGSIGVFSLTFDASDLFERHLGITFDGVSTDPSADAMSMLRPLTPQEVVEMETVVDAVYDEFLERVSESRGLSVEQVNALAQGRVWTGSDALEVGLVDALGGLSEVVEMAAAAAGLEPGSYRLRELPRPPSFLERMNRAMGTRIDAIALRFRPGLDPRLATVVGDMSALVDMAGSVQARMPVSVTVH